MTYSRNYGNLLKRQAELQRLGNMPMPAIDEVLMALLAEFGETAQESKPDWAWWKKPGDKGAVALPRVLEECADILHFILLLELTKHALEVPQALGQRTIEPQFAWTAGMKTGLVLVAHFALSHSAYSASCALCAYVSHYGFTPDDLARAYWEKTEVNLERWRKADEV